MNNTKPNIMHDSLKRTLNVWGTSPIIKESREFNPRYGVLSEGEYLIVLTMKIKVNLQKFSEIVIETRVFATQNQNDKTPNTNPDKDVEAMNQVMKIMELEFLNRQSKAFTLLVQKWDQEGNFS